MSPRQHLKPEVYGGQAALPCLLLAAPRPCGADAAADGADPHAAHVSELDLRGGTDAAMAPPAGYLAEVLLPMLRSRLGVSVALHVRAVFATVRVSCLM